MPPITVERCNRPRYHLCFLLLPQHQAVQPGNKCAPMQRSAIRVRGQVAGALVTLQPKTLRVLVEKRRPQVRAFTAIQPSQGLGRADTDRLGGRWQRQAQVAQVGLDCRKT